MSKRTSPESVTDSKTKRVRITRSNTQLSNFETFLNEDVILHILQFLNAFDYTPYVSLTLSYQIGSYLFHTYFQHDSGIQLQP